MRRPGPAVDDRVTGAFLIELRAYQNKVVGSPLDGRELDGNRLAARLSHHRDVRRVGPLIYAKSAFQQRSLKACHQRQQRRRRHTWRDPGDAVVTPATRGVDGERQRLELRTAPGATHVLNSIELDIAKERQSQMDRFLTRRLSPYNALHFPAMLSHCRLN